MKQVIIITSFLVLFFTCSAESPQNEYDFAMDIDLLVEEHSKDSNSQHYIINMTGNEVQYKYSYGGYRPGRLPQPRDEFELEDKDMDNLIKRIKRYKLLQNVNEEKPTKGLGNTIKVSFKVRMGKEVYQSNIKGMMYILKLKKGNLDNKKFAGNIHSIARIIHRKAIEDE